MSAPFITTVRLSNIIQMITLAQQSGILRVIRGHGTAREVGQIQFAEGEAIAALLGQLTGNSALSVLMNWGECLYSFDERAQADPLADLAALSNEGALPGTSAPSTPAPSFGSWPRYGYGITPPQSLGPLSGPVASDPGAMSLPPTGTPSRPRAGHVPGIEDDRAMQVPVEPPAQRSPGAATLPTLPALRPELISAVPYRLHVAMAAVQLPLDRRERMVLLLVDGQRTIADLARLTRRNEHDLYAVLSHLAMLGLIKFPQ